MMKDTLPKLLLRNYERFGDKQVAMRQKDFGIWREYTWKDEYENIKYLSLGLISLGLERGDKVSIIGDAEPEWYWSEIAVQAAGGVAAGIFTDAIPSEIKFIIEHCESRFVIARDQEQVDKMLLLKEELPQLQRIVYWEYKGLKNYVEPILIPFCRVLELGKEYEADHPGAFERNVAQGNSEDVAILGYTSGTTGQFQKAVILSHRNLLATIDAFFRTTPFNENDDQFSSAPPAWTAEQLVGLALHYRAGTKICFAESPDTILQDIREISPKMLIFPGRQWDSIVSTVQVKTSDASFIMRQLFNLCLPIGYKMVNLRSAGTKIGILWKSLYFVANLIVFRPLRDKLGVVKSKYLYQGGAPMSLDTLRFLHAIGIPVRNFYGVAEGSGLSTCPGKDNFKMETVGPPLLGQQIRISEQGEILIAGDNLCRGYYKDEEKTRSAIERGWFHTGDAGYIDDDGHLIWTDRVSELGTLARGTKYSPSYIEGKIKFSPYVKDAMVVGNNRDYISAIINIDFENVGNWAELNNVPYTTFADLSQKAEVANLILKHVQRTNKSLPEESRIRKYVCLHKELDPDEGELTRTRKLRRKFMEQRYQGLIDAIYQDKEEIRVEADVTYRDGRKGTISTGFKIRMAE